MRVVVITTHRTMHKLSVITNFSESAGDLLCLVARNAILQHILLTCANSLHVW